MLGLIDMKETRFYQETLEEGREEGREEEAKSLILRLLARKLGRTLGGVAGAGGQLELAVLEELGEALFDLESVEDLRRWLEERQDRE